MFSIVKHGDIKYINVILSFVLFIHNNFFFFWSVFPCAVLLPYKVFMGEGQWI